MQIYAISGRHMDLAVIFVVSSQHGWDCREDRFGVVEDYRIELLLVVRHGSLVVSIWRLAGTVILNAVPRIRLSAESGPYGK